MESSCVAFALSGSDVFSLSRVEKIKPRATIEVVNKVPAVRSLDLGKFLGRLELLFFFSLVIVESRK